MLPEANDQLIYPRVTLMLAMCLSFIIRIRRMSFQPADRTPL